MKKAGIIGVVAVMTALFGCEYLGPCLDGSGQVVSEFRNTTEFTGVTNTGSFDVYVTRSDSLSVEVVAQQNLVPIIETYVSGYTLIIKTHNNACYRSSIPVKVYITMPETELLRLSGSGRVFAEMVSGTEVEVSNSGSGYIEVDSVLADTYRIGNSGSGHISIEGSYSNEFDAVQSGSGTIICGNVYGTDDVIIRHSSSGIVGGVIMDGTVLDVVLSGSGSVELSGDVEKAEYTLSSSGKIDALDLMAPEADATNTGSGKIYVWATGFLDVTITGSGDIIYRGNPAITTRITGSGNVRPY
jgi:hypothetical protein